MKQLVEPTSARGKSGTRMDTHHFFEPNKSSANIRVILADDHQILLETLSMLLENTEDIEVVGAATDGRKVLELIASLRPDVVVMDVGMPGMNGIEATRRVLAAHPKIKVVALSAHTHKQYVLEMLEAGASAYIIKENTGSELVRALHAVMKGQKYLCPEVSAAVVDNTGQRETDGFHRLGPREREVLQLLAEGNSSPTIGKRLFISTSTVDAHRHNIMKKLGLHNVAELTKFAICNGMTSVDIADLNSLTAMKTPGKTEVRAQVHMNELHSSHAEAIIALTRAVEHREDDSGIHVLRISQYSRLLAETLGMDSEYCNMIHYASPMHDLGKIGIPDNILLKPSRHTREEFEIMKSHCARGADLLRGCESPFLKMGAEIAMNHHEVWDGTGYPAGLAGEKIPLAARIMGICDVYDALRSTRPYRPAFNHENAMKIIVDGDKRTMPGHFDPAVFNAFKQCSLRFNEIYQQQK